MKNMKPPGFNLRGVFVTLTPGPSPEFRRGEKKRSAPDLEV
jgi:hypothetical protein